MDFNLCILMDFENIAAGAEKEGHGRFDTEAVMTRLKEKGRILMARSYGDWGRFAKYKQNMLEQGIQAVELTSYRGQEKNRADIALAVDAMEIAFSRSYLDTFVLLSGDSDFTPLVMRLRELNRRVIGIGTRRSSSRLLVESCDEFIFYESIIRSRRAPPPEARPRPRPDAAVNDAVESLDKDEALVMLVETIEGLQKDEPGPVLAGRVKQSLLRKAPTFDETEYGYQGFARFLEAARDRGLVLLSQDDRAGGYKVDLPGDEPAALPRVREEDEEPSLPEVDTAPLLKGEAARLRDALIKVGVDPLTALMRHVVVYEFVDHVAERSRKKKRNTLIYTVGDVARRCRQTAPPVKPTQVRSVLVAAFRAGALLHADGNPIRRETAPFTLGNDAEDILRMLRTYFVDQLLELGEPLEDSRALSTLLWGDEDHMTPAEELVAWTLHERQSARPVDERPEREEAPPRPAPQVEERAVAEVSAAEPAEENEAPEVAPAEADGPARRRRRRRKRRGEGGAAGAPGDEDGASGDEAEASTEEPTAVEPAAVEPTAVEPAAVEPAAVEPAGEEPAAVEPAGEEPAARPRRSRRGYTRRTLGDEDTATSPAPSPEPSAAPADLDGGEQAPKRPRRRKATPSQEG
ncbi:NYN domain-containing protein [Myxococcota bacterium]|nr:NYN domain-containing protein [Myxococcota bacterium]